MYTLPSERDKSGLEGVFQSIFPITDFRETCSLEYVDYSVGNWECECGNLTGIENLVVICDECNHHLIPKNPEDQQVSCNHCGATNYFTPKICESCGYPVSLQIKFDIEECVERGITYSIPLHARIRLVVFDKDEETGAKTIRDIKEQNVYFGEFPLMTDNGTFIYNGTERVIVSQLHRSPGVFFSAQKKNLYTAQIIPYRGSWVEFETDRSDLLYVRIDRKRKFLATIFLRAMGLDTPEEVLRYYYHPMKVRLENSGKVFWQISDFWEGYRPDKPLKGPKSGKVLIKAGSPIRKRDLKKLEEDGVTELELDAFSLESIYAIADIVNTETGEVLVSANDQITPEVIALLLENNFSDLEVIMPEHDDIGPTLINTLARDIAKTRDNPLIEIYRRLRPGDPPTPETSRLLFENMFFNPQRYDFSRVGRLKINTKLGLDTDLDERVLKQKDYLEVVKYLFRMAAGNLDTSPDDIDHLGNRRVRSVGELIENQFRIGLARMERAIKEKMTVSQELATMMPQDLINSKPVMSAIREFFGSSQLSQFMDQTNPLSEITHKRRLSALGPGGLSRERAGFEVRDVHSSHYGRICPIETPEGPNIGLISSLSTYAKINEFGFIESPYRKVDQNKIVSYVRITRAPGSQFKLGEVVPRDDVDNVNKDLKKKFEYEPYAFYLSAWEEDKYRIAQANAPRKDRELLSDRIAARKAGETLMVPREDIEFIDVSPVQLVSVAASLIPFLEHDDANRALMGSNMQRQAVPLLNTEAPLVGTGMEEKTARDSNAVVLCRRPGVVEAVDAERIIVRVQPESGDGQFGADIYRLIKFKRSNQNTCINQIPIVHVGDAVQKGDVLADGSSTDEGELALGRNVLVAFLPWRGYNFEDAILVSEKLVKEDAYTSIHIEEFTVTARDTKLGKEEITRDIPNVSEEFLKDLDDSGIIKIGSKVKPGSILVGKVVPKGETQLSPEEKLLRAIFGDKAADFRDASLLTPPGIEGVVVDVKVFTRRGEEKDQRTLEIEQEIVQKKERELSERIKIIKNSLGEQIRSLVKGLTLSETLFDPDSGEEFASKSAVLDAKLLKAIPAHVFVNIQVKDKIQSRIDEMKLLSEKKIKTLRQKFNEKIEQLQQGDELSPGEIKMIKVFIAMKRKLSVGDKMAGRHGNKGVLAAILPEEDMPYLPDGTPVEIVLNPLGVPSRMNVGQILETHLGWAAKVLGLKFATPVFDGATEGEIGDYLNNSNLPEDGKTILFDGMTGEQMMQKVTVGYIYMLKLHHLVDDKIHARSIGPYSLITQQPLGGKAQFGGQRFGEMEVWALEAYGAAHTLQELLTAKSDDVFGRAKIYESIVRGETALHAGLPESFNVLLREMQSLCLNVELLRKVTDEDIEEEKELDE
ncbi:MAG: DNA-directed RNA polymerase subunit beta [Acidobacteria bacterium]|nr:DNA-directed RNA polymerase subunit beta [Acidobacteriota bacterium]